MAEHKTTEELFAPEPDKIVMRSWVGQNIEKDCVGQSFIDSQFPDSAACLGPVILAKPGPFKAGLAVCFIKGNGRLKLRLFEYDKDRVWQPVADWDVFEEITMQKLGGQK